MICLICREAKTRHGTTTITLMREGLSVTVKDVPAQVCPECGEGYVGEEVAVCLLAIAERSCSREGLAPQEEMSNA